MKKVIQNIKLTVSPGLANKDQNVRCTQRTRPVLPSLRRHVLGTHAASARLWPVMHWPRLQKGGGGFCPPPSRFLLSRRRRPAQVYGYARGVLHATRSGCHQSRDTYKVRPSNRMSCAVLHLTLGRAPDCTGPSVGASSESREGAAGVLFLSLLSLLYSTTTSRHC